MMNKEDTTYNGWANYETWNVALWIGNDEGLYDIAKQERNYLTLVNTLRGNDIKETMDGVSYSDPKLDIDELDAMMEEL